MRRHYFPSTSIPKVTEVTSNDSMTPRFGVLWYLEYVKYPARAIIVSPFSNLQTHTHIMKEFSRNMDLDLDISDEVSALSMDGASAIAGRVMATRLRKNIAKMQMGIPEDDEEQAAAVVMLDENEWTNGCELIEPFPLTHEEWQEENEKKKERKQTHKSKKHHKHGGKSESSLSRDESHGKKSHSSSKRRDKHSQQQRHQNMEDIIGEQGSPPPPMTEIAIDATKFPSSESGPRLPTLPSGLRSRNQKSASDASVPSAASTSNSKYACVSAYSSQEQQRQSSSSHAGGGAMGMAIKRSRAPLRSSFQTPDSQFSLGDNESLTQMTGHSTHTTEPCSQSQVTPEDMHQLLVLLENARTEERQVLEIYKRLKKEFQVATIRQERAKHHRQSLTVELQVLLLEHEQLQKELENLHSDNDKLRSKLSSLQEREEDRGLDDVLDSMEAKIKALKLKRERRASSKGG